MIWLSQITGEPSANLMTEMSETEKKRVAEQWELLGEEGLNSKRQQLEKATEDNEVMITKKIELIVINSI